MTLLNRKALGQLEAWKQRAENHALLITGARQVGKSTLLEEFGRRAYPNVVRFDLYGKTAEPQTVPPKTWPFASK